MACLEDSLPERLRHHRLRIVGIGNFTKKIMALEGYVFCFCFWRSFSAKNIIDFRRPYLFLLNDFWLKLTRNYLFHCSDGVNLWGISIAHRDPGRPGHLVG